MQPPPWNRPIPCAWRKANRTHKKTPGHKATALCPGVFLCVLFFLNRRGERLEIFQALLGDDTEQFVIALRPAQPQRSYQNTADEQASLDSNLQVTFGQPEHVKVRGKFLARALAQVAQNDDGLAQLLQVTL